VKKSGKMKFTRSSQQLRNKMHRLEGCFEEELRGVRGEGRERGRKRFFYICPRIHRLFSSIDMFIHEQPEIKVVVVA
jgi:hypothetical protein